MCRISKRLLCFLSFPSLCSLHPVYTSVCVGTHRGKDFWQVCRTWCCMYSSSTYFTLYIKSISSTRSTYWLASILSIVNCNIKYFLDYFALLFTLLRKSIAVWPDVVEVVPVSISFQFSTFPPYEAPKVANTLLVVTSNNLTWNEKFGIVNKLC